MTEAGPGSQSPAGLGHTPGTRGQRVTQWASPCLTIHTRQTLDLIDSVVCHLTKTDLTLTRMSVLDVVAIKNSNYSLMCVNSNEIK